MTIALFLFLAFSFVYVFYLPGYMLTRHAFPERDPVLTFAMSLGLSISLMGILCFIVALLFRTVINEGVIFGTATAVILICAAFDSDLKAGLRKSKEPGKEASE